MQCEQEGGRCDLEKLGYDGGEALADNADKAGIPTELPGGTEQTGNIQARSRRMVDD